MAQVRVFMRNDVPDIALEELGKLPGVGVTGRMVSAEGGVIQEEECVVIFYTVEGKLDRGRIRIPMVSVGVVDEGVHTITMGGRA